MTIAWFMVPMSTRPRVTGSAQLIRYCAMDDFTTSIFAAGGSWDAQEGLGGVALVKIFTADALLTTITGTAGFIRVTDRVVLTDTLSTLTAAQRNTIQNKLLSNGYSQAEINAAMGNTLALWRTHTLLDLLTLILTRVRRPASMTAQGVVTFETTDLILGSSFVIDLNNRIT